MRISFYITCLFISLALLIDTAIVRGYAMTFLHVQCGEISAQNAPEDLLATKLGDSKELVFTHYSPIGKVRLVNHGGHQITQCDAYRLPKGISVMVSADGHTCEIVGIPTRPQARTQGYVIARNKKGSSLAIVTISVNALVFGE